MSYDAEKIKSGREPVFILELELNFCKHAFSVSPCTASLLGAGLQCFNTRGSCQDTPNFDRDTPGGAITGTKKIYRFSSIRIDELQGDGEPPTFPTLMTVSTAPTRLEPGKGLGVRSSVKISVKDFPFTDDGVDPYLSSRTVDFADNGTFFGRLLSRNPFYEGRVLRILQGYLDDDGTYNAANMQTRTYVISRIAGPDSKGNVKIEGKDPLRAADGQRNQFPRITDATLTADINDSVTSIAIDDPDGDIDTAYSAGQPWVRIDDEIMEVTNVSGSGPAYTLTVTRATLPSPYTKLPEADDHKDESTVQPCHFFDNVRIDDLIYFLLNTGAGIDASFLPLADWAEVIDNGLDLYSFTALIIEPTPVKTLVVELTEMTVYIWWDERDQEVKLDSLQTRSFDAGPFTDEDNIIADSIEVTKDVKNRISQIWIHTGHRSPLESLTDIESFQKVTIRADLDAETEDEYGTSKILKIFSRWMPIGLGSVANEVAAELLSQYGTTQTVITMRLDPKDDTIWTGAGVRVITRQIQDNFGESQENDFQILQAKEKLKSGGVEFQYVMQGAQGITRLRRLGGITPDTNPEDEPNPFPDYPDASDDLRSRYAFISTDAGFMSDGSVAYGIR